MTIAIALVGGFGCFFYIIMTFLGIEGLSEADIKDANPLYFISILSL